MTRQEANLEIVNLILDKIEKYPDWRFGQILANIEVIKYDKRALPKVLDPFYEESTETLERIKSNL